jgi:hypothetical protein
MAEAVAKTDVVRADFRGRKHESLTPVIFIDLCSHMRVILSSSVPQLLAALADE